MILSDRAAILHQPARDWQERMAEIGRAMIPEILEIDLHDEITS